MIKLLQNTQTGKTELSNDNFRRRFEVFSRNFKRSAKRKFSHSDENAYAFLLRNSY